MALPAKPLPQQSPVAVSEPMYAVIVGPPLAAGAEEVPVALHACEKGVLHKTTLHEVCDAGCQGDLQATIT